MGMKVVCPATAADVKGLLKAAIRDNDPVMVFLPLLTLAAKDEVPDEDYIIPIGKGKITREGTDATIVAAGHLLPQAMIVAKEFEAKGISLEVINPLTLYPFDKDLIIESVKKTGKLLVADDGYRMCSWSSEVAATIADEAFEYLKAPVKRITRPMVYPPLSKAVEMTVIPMAPQLAIGVNQLLGIE